MGPPTFRCPAWDIVGARDTLEGGQGRKYGVVFTGLASSLSLGVGSQGPYLHLRTFVLMKTPFPFWGLSLPISTMGLQSLSQVCSLRKPFRVCFGKNPETALRQPPEDLNSITPSLPRPSWSHHPPQSPLQGAPILGSMTVGVYFSH